MFRIYRAFVKKEMLHIWRDRRTLLILIGLPIALVLIFGYTVTNEFRDASVAILDQSRDALSAQFIEKIQASGHFRIDHFGEDIESIETSFASGAAKMAFVIPADFELNFYRGYPLAIQLITDASEPNYAATLMSYAGEMVRSFEATFRKAVNQSPLISVETRMYYNPKLVGAYNFIPGVAALLLMLVSAMMTSLTIAREKELGTMDLLLVSPLPPLLIIVGKVTPYVLLAFFDALLVFAMGYFIFGVPIKGSLPLLLLLCLLYLTVALSLGILISTKAATQQTAMMGSLFVLMLPTMLLSNFMFPVASMPVLLQFLSNIVPARYFVDIEQAIMLKGAGFEAVQYPAMILGIMLIILLAAAWRNFKVVYR